MATSMLSLQLACNTSGQMSLPCAVRLPSKEPVVLQKRPTQAIQIIKVGNNVYRVMAASQTDVSDDELAKNYCKQRLVQVQDGGVSEQHRTTINNIIRIEDRRQNLSNVDDEDDDDDDDDANELADEENSEHHPVGNLLNLTMANAASSEGNAATTGSTAIVQGPDGRFFVPVVPAYIGSDVDENVLRVGVGTEELTMKREIRLYKNREAARECRRKKKEYVRCLENRVAVLENQNKTLINELKSLKELYCQKEPNC